MGAKQHCGGALHVGSPPPPPLLRLPCPSPSALLPPTPAGSISVLHMNGAQEWCLGKDGWLASTPGIEIDKKTQKVSHGLFSGEGFFVVKLSGAGTCFVASFGGIQPLDIAPGEVSSRGP